MSTFTLSLLRLDDAAAPTAAERLARSVDWPHLPRKGETVTVGLQLCLDCSVADVWHEEGDVVVDLGRAELDNDECFLLVQQGWERRTVPESLIEPGPCVRPGNVA